MWDAKRIELAEFKAPVSTVPAVKPKEGAVPAETNENGLPKGYTLDQKGNWFTVTGPDGKAVKMLGKKKLTAYLETVGGD